MARDHHFRDGDDDDDGERPPALRFRLQLHQHLLLHLRQLLHWYLTHQLTRHCLRPCAYGDHGHRDGDDDVADHLDQVLRHRRWTHQLIHSQVQLIQWPLQKRLQSAWPYPDGYLKTSLAFRPLLMQLTQGQ